MPDGVCTATQPAWPDLSLSSIRFTMMMIREPTSPRTVPQNCPFGTCACAPLPPWAAVLLAAVLFETVVGSVAFAAHPATRPQHARRTPHHNGSSPCALTMPRLHMSRKSRVDPHPRAPEIRNARGCASASMPGSPEGALTREEPVGHGRLQHQSFRSILASIDAVHL